MVASKFTADGWTYPTVRLKWLQAISPVGAFQHFVIGPDSYDCHILVGCPPVTAILGSTYYLRKGEWGWGPLIEINI